MMRTVHGTARLASRQARSIAFRSQQQQQQQQQQQPARLASSSASSSSGASEEHYPTEGFNSPLWKYALALAGVAALASRVSSTSPSSDHDPASFGVRLQRWLSYNLSYEEGLFKERNLKHLGLARQAAEDRLLMVEAEKPPVKRLRFTGAFQQASPHCIVTGSQADLSDLSIKSPADDAAALDAA